MDPRRLSNWKPLGPYNERGAIFFLNFGLELFFCVLFRSWDMECCWVIFFYSACFAGRKRISLTSTSFG